MAPPSEKIVNPSSGVSSVARLPTSPSVMWTCASGAEMVQKSVGFFIVWKAICFIPGCVFPNFESGRMVQENA